MLEAFLETVCEHEKRASAERQNLELLSRLPTPELLKLAGGMTLKEAFFPESADWLEKFKDTPLLQDAIALEKESLNIEMEEQANRRENDQLYRDNNSRRDELSIKKKLLDLQLAEQDAGGGGEEVVEEEVEVPPPPAPEKVEQAANAVQPPPDLDKAAMAMRFAFATEALGLSSGTKSGTEKTAVSKRWVAQHVSAAAKSATPERMAKAHGIFEGINQRSVGRLMERMHAGAPSARTAANVGAKANHAAQALKDVGGKSLESVLADKSHGVSSAAKTLVEKTRPSPAHAKGFVPLPKPSSHGKHMMIGAGTGVALGAGAAAASSGKDKAAAVLTMEHRTNLSKKEFAIPKGAGPGGTKGKYPIHDESHARNALTRVRQFGNAGEKAKVYSAVAKKYPGLAERSSINAVQKKVAHISPEREQQIKEAFGAALMQGVQGAGKFLGMAGKGIASAAASPGGAGSALQAAKSFGKVGLQRAGKFIAANPLAGAAMVAAPVAAGSYMAGRATS